jgi:hypothetical protein
MAAKHSKSTSRLPGDLSPFRAGLFAAVFVIVQFLYHSLSSVPWTVESVTVTLVGAVLSSIVIGFLTVDLPGRAWSRLIVLWLALFVVQLFADLVEGAFFTTKISSATVFLGGTFVAMLVTFAEAGTAVLVFPSSVASMSIRDLLRDYLVERTGYSWAIRIAVGGLAYFPVYFLFGALVAPYVIPYYTNPSNGLGLTIPPLSVLISVELLRGFLFVLCVFPVLAFGRYTPRGLFLFLASFFYIIGAFVPFVAGTTLPWFLKAVHSGEILADSIVYSAVLTYLFKGSIRLRKSRSDLSQF